MFPTVDAIKSTMKVSFGADDVRRLPFELPAASTGASTLAALQGAVTKGFDLSEAQAARLVLKYVDDEGDVCTLTEHTIEDFAVLAGTGLWRLRAELLPAAAPAAAAAPAPAARAPAYPAAASPAPAVLPAVAAQAVAGNEAPPSTPLANTMSPAAAAAPGHVGAGTPTAAEASCRGPEDDEDEDEEEEDHEPLPAWLEMYLPYLLNGLPIAAQFIQNEDVQAGLNRGGEENHKALVPFCRDLAAHLRRTGEAPELAAAAEAFAEGRDVQHFGDVSAKILAALAASESKPALLEILKRHHRVLAGVARHAAPGFMQAPGPWAGLWGKGKGKKGKGKGKGKGFDFFASIMQAMQQPGMGQGGWPPAAWAHGHHHRHHHHMGAAGAPPFSPAGMFQGIIGNLMAQGLGPQFQQHMAAAASSAGQQTQQQQQQQSPVAANYDEQVGALLEMGLVTDAELARDLLASHGGDMAKVVDILAGGAADAGEKGR